MRMLIERVALLSSYSHRSGFVIMAAKIENKIDTKRRIILDLYSN